MGNVGLDGLAEPEYHAIISFGLPIEPEDSQYGQYLSRVWELTVYTSKCSFQPNVGLFASGPCKASFRHLRRDELAASGSELSLCGRQHVDFKPE